MATAVNIADLCLPSVTAARACSYTMRSKVLFKEVVRLPAGPGGQKYQRCLIESTLCAVCVFLTSEESQGQLQLIVGVSPQLAEGGREG